MKLLLHPLLVGSFTILSVLGAEEMQAIDTHVHFFEPVKLDWLKPGNQRLNKPHYAAQYEALAADTPLNQVVLIEAGISLEHNEWMLQHATENALVAAVIANLDLESPTFAEYLSRFALHPKFRGIRNRARGAIDFESDLVLQHLSLMAEREMILESGVSDSSYEALAAIAEAFPRLTIILNHMAGGVLNEDDEPKAWWAEAVSSLSRYPNVYCKLSMYDAAFRGDYSEARMAALFDPLIDAFGPDRLLFGSNWPHSADYHLMLDLFEKAIVDMNQRQAVLSENPKRAYRLSNQSKP